MSDLKNFSAQRGAATVATTNLGPTADHYSSALERYLKAVSGEHAAPDTGNVHGALYWNIENNLVRDVMTTPVFTVGEQAPFKEIVDTLARHRISAVPVVDADDRVVGIVSESDLLAKVVAGGDPKPRMKFGQGAKSETRRKSHAETARELMNAPVVTISPDSSIVHAARVAALEHVRRLPVVDASNMLLGIVTRSDLLSVFRRDDEEIRRHVADDLIGRQFCRHLSEVEVTVRHGVVALTGQVERRMLIGPLVDAVRQTAGVVSVHDDIAYRIDDTVVPPPMQPIRH
jgi:CBS domain-containing protein